MWYGHFSGLLRMLVLVMITFGVMQNPPILLQPVDNILASHGVYMIHTHEEDSMLISD
jgi:hypothetical protein